MQTGTELQLLRDTAWLQTLTRNLVRDPHAAEDVAQEAFLSLLRQPIGSVRRVRPWLSRVARRLATRVPSSRHEDRRDLPGPTEPYETVEPADVVAKAAMQREVVGAVLRLGEPYRTAILLHYLEQLTIVEVATRTGSPLETVRTRVRRGLQMLRADLRRRHGDARRWAVPILGCPAFEQLTAGAATTATTSGAVTSSGVTSGAATSGATATGAALLPGVLLMSLNAKIAAGVLVGAALFGIWSLSGFGEPPPAPPVITDAPAAAESAMASPMTTTTPEAPEVTREKVAENEPPPTAPVPAGPILRSLCTGRVVDGATGRPLGGAEVSLRPPPFSKRPAAKVRTGRDGRFELDDRAPLYESAHELVVRYEDLAPRYVELLSHAMTRVGAGAERRAELGDIELVRGVAVGGRVLDEHGATGIADARVFRYRMHGAVTAEVFASADLVASTDTEGRYRLTERVAAGQWRHILIAVSARGVGYAAVEADNGERGSTENVEREIRLRPSLSLRVEAVDDTGKPVAGARVQVDPMFAPLGSAERYQQRPSRLGDDARVHDLFVARTGDDGIAQFPALPRGDDSELWGKVTPGDSYRVFAGIEGAPRTWRDVRLSRDASVRLVVGRGAAFRIEGRVVDPQGGAVGGAKVTVMGNPPSGSEADGAGHFALDSVKPTGSTVYISATADGFTLASKREAVRPGAEVLEVELVLRPAGGVRGVVLDQHGVPVARAEVWHGETRPVLHARAMTNDRGEFEIAKVPLGKRMLRINPPSEGEWRGVERRDAPVPGPPLRIVLHRLEPGVTSLRARLVEAETHRPLRPAHCALIPLDERGGARGKAVPTRIEDGVIHAEKLVAGRWRLLVGAREGHSGQHVLEVQPGQQVVEASIELRAPATLTLRIDLSGVAQADRPEQITVSCYPWSAGKWHAPERVVNGDPRSNRVTLDVTDEMVVEVRNAAPGLPHTFRVVAPDAFAGEVKITAGSGERGAATLAVTAGGRLRFELPKMGDNDWVSAQVHYGDGKWSQGTFIPFPRLGEKGLTSTVRAGQVFWRVLRYRRPANERLQAEGSIAVGPGKTETVKVEFRAR